MNVRETIISGKKLWYIDEGKGKPIVLVHGWGISPLSYSESIRALSKKYHVIVPFFRPYGSWEKIPEYINQIMNHFQMQKAIIMGHSTSGIQTAEFARQYSNRIEGLILIDTLGFDNRSLLSWFFIWLMHVIHLMIPKGVYTIGSTSRLFWDFFTQLVRYPRSLLHEAKVAVRADITLVLRELNIPVLVVWGNTDDLVVPPSKKLIHNLNPKITLSIVLGRHDWIKHDANKLLDIVESFIKQL